MLAVIRCKIASVETHERYERWRKARSSADYAHASVRAQEMINDDSTELRRARDKAKADLKRALAHLTSVCADKDVFTPPPTFDADRDYEEVKRYTAELNAWLGRIAPAFATLPVLPDPDAPAPESNANAGQSSTTPDDLMDVDEEFREVPPTDLHTRLKLLDAEIEKYKRDEYDYAPPASNIAAEKEEQIRARLEPRVAAAVKARKTEMADHTAARMQRIDEVMETRAKESVASLGQIRANQLLIMQLRAKKAENEAIKERVRVIKSLCALVLTSFRSPRRKTNAKPSRRKFIHSTTGSSNFLPGIPCHNTNCRASRKALLQRRLRSICSLPWTALCKTSTTRRSFPRWKPCR